MIIARAPVRVSFLGGATDYPEFFQKHGGAVLGTAIDKYAFIAVSERFGEIFDEQIRIAYSRVEQVGSVDDIEHLPFRECLRRCGVTENVEVNYFANLPAFTGLGSSSTFVATLLQALYAYKGVFVHGMDLAYETIDMERKVLKESVGCQDQVFAAMGGFNLIEFRGERDIVVNRLPLSPGRVLEFQEHLMMFFTGIKRRAEEVVKKQIKRMDLNEERLKRMLMMVDDGYKILTGNKAIEEFGNLLHQSWCEKRSLESTITNSEIDNMYNAGMEAGAIGGKLLGAGGGGFILFFVPPERKQAVRERLKNYYELKFNINAPGSQIILNQ
ncbi:ghmp kinase, putative [Heliomicrobium modesticaldum Ice1]|uniref:Ghmp kinase, putative n=1 Tax=Heliobacterium modesticaldum (strain ATCC 51547 / Ice1) TaxID=498761 RepID=B0THJ0_HELMI|nr:GHMP kinase [Heliomicrobium modesticaldum]ABZ83428.1 ghmp kinase, putative [Heliomicrobium modesticaldum Ice1]